MTTTHYKQLVDIYNKTRKAFRVLGFEPHPPGVNNHMHLIEVGFGLPPVWAGEARPRHLVRLVGKSGAQIDGDWSRTQWPHLALEGRLFWMPQPNVDGSKPGCFIVLSDEEDGDGALETEMDIVRDLARDDTRTMECRRDVADQNSRPRQKKRGALAGEEEVEIN